MGGAGSSRCNNNQKTTTKHLIAKTPTCLCSIRKTTGSARFFMRFLEIDADTMSELIILRTGSLRGRASMMLVWMEPMLDSGVSHSLMLLNTTNTTGIDAEKDKHDADYH